MIILIMVLILLEANGRKIGRKKRRNKGKKLAKVTEDSAVCAGNFPSRFLLWR